MTETNLIDCFKQSWPKRMMNFESSVDQLGCQSLCFRVFRRIPHW